MRKRMDDHIYVMTHKEFTPPPDEFYFPLHVGRKNSEVKLPYKGDDTGDNISEQNCYYSELTGMYWVWKNVDSDVVGICHYRRYLLDEKGHIFTLSAVRERLKKYDIITTKNLELNFPYDEGFASHHKIVYLTKTAEVISEIYPEYYLTFQRLVHEKHTYFGNMLIAKKTLYDSYMEWLFGILSEVQRRVKVEEEDSYHRRIFGFISEFLQYVFMVHNKLKICECMVGMMGEKAEVAETKKQLALYFLRGDFEGAKRYLLMARSRRPDLLMEASDVTGELHMSMEIISIAGLEQKRYGTNILDNITDFKELMAFCNKLNRYALSKGADPELSQWARENKVTEVAVQVAEAVTSAMGKDGDKMYSII